MKTAQVYRAERALRTALATGRDYPILKKRAEKIVCAARLKPYCSVPASLSNHLDQLLLRGQLIKHDQTSTVASIDAEDQAWIVKRYNNRGLIHSLRMWLAGARAEKAFYRGLLLESLGIATPKPLFYAVKYRFGLPFTSYIVNVRSQGEPLCNLFDRGQISTDGWVRAIAQAEDLVDRLHRLGITHGDLKSPNLLFDGVRLEVIDLDSLRIHRWQKIFRRFRDKDLNVLATRVADYPHRNGVK